MIDRVLQRRSRILFSAIVCAYCFVGVRLFYIQYVAHNELKKKANSQHNIFLKDMPVRGTIFDRNLHAFSVNRAVKSVFAVPPEVVDPAKTAEVLSSVLEDIEYDVIKQRLKREKSFVWIKRKISNEKYKRLKALDLPGIYFKEELRRTYPKGRLLSHVLGFVDIDNKGLEGLELSMDKTLRGKDGDLVLTRDARGKLIASHEVRQVPAEDGCHLVLTIDEYIQYIAERELEKACAEFNALSGTVVVMRPDTGEILALANRPTFDPNTPAAASLDSRRNRALTDMYEPGSTFKIISGAAALSKGVISLDDQIFCENGAFRNRGMTLHDHKPHGFLTFKEVIQKSSNIGIAKVGIRLGGDELYEMIKKFGFGELTGCNLPGEVSGVVRNPKQWSKSTLMCIPMGHEICVTPIQLVRAFCAIANGGFLMEPIIIKKVLDDHEIVLSERKPMVVRRVISPEAAEGITAAMKSVVSREGTAYRAAIDGFEVAGKTGTAQKVDSETGRYSHKDFIASFVGFVPAEDPLICVLVMLNNPKPVYYGGVVAAPVFKVVARESLMYMGINPDMTMVKQ